MKTRFTSLALIVLLTSTTTLPQRKASRTKPAPTKTAAKAESLPNYRLNLKIGDGPKLSVSIDSSDTKGNIEPSELKSFITDLPSGRNKFSTPSDLFPRVMVEASPNISMLDFWNPITLFPQGRTEIQVSIPTGLPTGGEILLTVPWQVSEPSFDVKPNPLWLVVTVAADGKLSLNTEPAGTTSNTVPLTNRLQQVFREREVNGIFREGTNEIEKSVTIAMPMSDRKFSDLITIARAIWLPGGDRIALAMDDPFVDLENAAKELFPSDSLLDLPPIPTPKKKP